MASTTSTSGTVLTGLASGINWSSLITAMTTAEAAPEASWNSEITNLNNKNTAYTTLGTDLSALQADVAKLSDPGFFQSSITSSSNSGVATATAASGTALGSYNFTVDQLATAASLTGAAVSAQPINLTSNVDGVVLGSSSFASPISAGSFTINGQTITVADSDSLQSVFTQIGTATGGAVSATYDPTSDKITLQSSSPIELGSAADTSNFLQATGLFNNGTGTITSANPLGTIDIYSADADASGLSTPINDGGSGNGSFTINGVSISYDASTDTVNDILNNINSSAAGVTASYNSVTHQFSLANNSTGDVGLTLADNTGNFLAATGLSSGTTTQGKNLKYTVDGSATLTSESNTINGSSIGIVGLSVTAEDTGTAQITVGSDTSTMSTAITQFVNDYNTAQQFIASQTATTTNSSGATTPGLLTGDFKIEEISTRLRTMTNSSPAGMPGSVQTINDIGITSNGQDNTLSINATTLNQALTSNLSAVQQLFTQSATGLGSQLNSYLLNTIGGNGPLINGESSFATQITSLNTSITQLQAKISLDSTALQNQFVAMEDAINKSNTDKQYLTAYFNSNSASAAPAASSINSGGSSSSPSSSSSGSSGI